MTNVVDIPRLESGVVRVFDVLLDTAAARDFANDPPTQARALGLPRIEADYVRVFPVTDLEGLGLSGYVTEGLGIDPETVADDKGAIDALTGHVAVITSKAFGDGGVTLRVVPPFKLIATFAEDTPRVSFTPLASQAAHGTINGPAAPPPPPARGGSLGFAIALLILLAAVIGLASLRGSP